MEVNENDTGKPLQGELLESGCRAADDELLEGAQVGVGRQFGEPAAVILNSDRETVCLAKSLADRKNRQKNDENDKPRNTAANGYPAALILVKQIHHYFFRVFRVFRGFS